MYIYIHIYTYIHIHTHTHCRRLCKTTEIFVRIENAFFYLIFTLTHLVFGFLIFVYIYISGKFDVGSKSVLRTLLNIYDQAFL